MALNITGAMVFLLITVSIALGRCFDDPWWFSMFAVAATGVTTFFGIIRHQLDRSKSGRITNAILRLAIAAAVTVAYIVTVACTMFIHESVFKPSELTKQFVTSFTTITGIVMAFYFGVSGYVDAQTNGRRNQEKAEGE